MKKSSRFFVRSFSKREGLDAASFCARNMYQPFAIDELKVLNCEFQSLFPPQRIGSFIIVKLLSYGNMTIKPCTIKWMYFHLATHSAYSLQEGILPPEDLALAAQRYGMSTLGLTDHRLLTGAVEFAAACNRLEIQPILGLEIDLDQGPLQLLATSTEGWSNLCRLSSSLALRDEPEAACALEMLNAYCKHLIALGSNQLDELKTIFPDRLYVALRKSFGRTSSFRTCPQIGITHCGDPPSLLSFP